MYLVSIFNHIAVVVCYRLLKKFFIGTTCVTYLTWLNLQSHNDVLPVAQGQMS